MPSISYHKQVYDYVKQTVKPEILQAQKNSPEIRAEISKVFQQANRRIQNIESKGLISPAVQALNKGDVKGFTKFSMRQDFNSLKIEYAKAVSFLRQPTSTATGTRDYNRYLMNSYGLTEDEFNLMEKKLNDKLTSVSDSDFVERYLMHYKDFTGELEQSASDISTQIESDAESLARSLDQSIEQTAESTANKAAEKVADTVDGVIDAIEETLRKFKI